MRGSTLWAAMLAQAGAESGGVSATVIIVVIAVVIVVGLIALLMRQGSAEEPEPEQRPPRKAEERERPTVDPLADRETIFEELSDEEIAKLPLKELREYKRALRVHKERRQTAVEATEASREAHGSEGDVDDEAVASDGESDEEVVEAQAEADEGAEEAAAQSPAAETAFDDDLALELSEGLGDDVSEADMGWADMGDLDLEASADELPVVDDPDSEPEEVAAADADASVDASEDAEVASEVAAEPEPAVEAEPQAESGSEPADESAAQASELEEDEGRSMREGLTQTREGFFNRLGSLFKRETIDDNLLEEVEEVLYTADIGPAVAEHIIGKVNEELSKDEKSDPGVIWSFIREYVEDVLRGHESSLDLTSATPFVILVIGVNGVGKTTTIGKMASRFKREGKSVMLVAGDTFRAAAVEQLEIWAKRVALPLHKGKPEADPASVIYGGVEAAVEQGCDIVICDTAGRLHNKKNLLDELRKIHRVAGKVVEGAPHETILVLDANTGQNAISQARDFSEAAPVTGIVLTKLDGTAKGGVILGICEELEAPVRYIGIGEGVYDLRPFDAQEFVDALFA